MWWAMILFPPTADDVSQVGLQDDPILVGHSNPKRLWLSEVIASVYRRHSRRTTPGVDEPPLLFGLSVAEYSRLFRRACIAAQVPDAVPHQLRHGGASADAAETTMTPDQIQGRGRWGHQKSVARYMKPGRYLRELSKSSAQQKDRASSLPNTLKHMIADRLR